MAALAVVFLGLCALFPEYQKHSPQLRQLNSLDVKNDLISSQPRAREFTAPSHKNLTVSEAQDEAFTAPSNKNLTVSEAQDEAFTAPSNKNLIVSEAQDEACNASGNGTLKLWDTPAEAFHVPPNMIRKVSKKDPLQSLDSDTTASGPPGDSNTTASGPPDDSNTTASGPPGDSNTTATNQSGHELAPCLGPIYCARELETGRCVHCWVYGAYDTGDSNTTAANQSGHELAPCLGPIYCARELETGRCVHCWVYGAYDNQKDQEDPLHGSEVYIFFFAQFILFGWAMCYRKNGLLIASVVYTIGIGSLHCMDIFYVMVIFSFFTALVLGSWMRTASFFRAKLTSYLTVLEEELSNARRTRELSLMKLHECRHEIVLTMFYFGTCVHELESGVWNIGISKEKESVMSLVTDIDQSALDFGDHTYYGKTYRVAVEELSRCVNSQAQQSEDVEDGRRRLPGPDVSGPQVAGNPHPPVSGVVSPVPSVRSEVS